MNKIIKRGFTVIELVVVILVIGILVASTTIAYRKTQQNARNEKYKSDALMIQTALDEYYADKGEYPVQSCNQGGNTYECRESQIWSTLVTQKYLKSVPKPSDTTHYYYRRDSTTTYGIHIPREPTACKISKGTPANWWSSAPECDYS